MVFVAGLLLLTFGCASGPEKRRPKDPATTGAETVLKEVNKTIKGVINETGKEVRKETRKVIRKKK